MGSRPWGSRAAVARWARWRTWAAARRKPGARSRRAAEARVGRAPGRERWRVALRHLGQMRASLATTAPHHGHGLLITTSVFGGTAVLVHSPKMIGEAPGDVEEVDEAVDRIDPSDLAFGAFSDHAPWIVEPDRMRWRDQVPMVRWAVRRQLPELVARASCRRAHGCSPCCGTWVGLGRLGAHRSATRWQRLEAGPVTTSANRGRAAGSDLHQARTDHQQR